jgi:1,4-dihydroxy-2-naphthoate polyprenyltransferase
MLHRSTLQLLRFHFSFFLMPVYLFAVSQLDHPDWERAFLIFCILHLLVYPASNGYNSYMDRDEGSIGGIEKPMQPTRQLFIVSVIMDVVAILLSFFISIYFAAGIFLYILASKAYSYRGIRLKRFPVAGYLTVVIFQGAVTFWITYHGSHAQKSLEAPLYAAIASSLLIGGFYPLTQIYQHEADRKDGVNTISALLGYKGTFIFTALIYLLAFAFLGLHFFSVEKEKEFLILNIFMSPIIVFFFTWAARVWKDVRTADFRNTMKMNLLACTCTNAGFITIIIQRISE